MVLVKVIQASHTSEPAASSRFEEKINSFIQQEITGTNRTLMELRVSSTSHKNLLVLTAIITYSEKKSCYDQSKNAQILNALTQSIQRKEHFLVTVNVAKGEGVEDVFYGDLIDIGCIRHSAKAKSDFQEFEFKAVTSNDRNGTTLKRAFQQNKEKVVAVIAASEDNLESLKELEMNNVVSQGDIVEFPTKVDNEYRNKWMAVVIERK